MKKSSFIPLLFVAATAAVPASISPEAACAAGQAHAGIVIRYSDAREKTHCVRLPGASASGIKALQSTGVDVVVKQDPAFGAFVCKIGEVGPDAADCPSRAGFWAYWHFEDGKWIFAATGASDYEVKCGAVDGWVWTQGESGSPPSFAAGYAAACPGKTCPSSVSEKAAPRPPPAAQSAGRLPLAVFAAAGLGLAGGLLAWRLRVRRK